MTHDTVGQHAILTEWGETPEEAIDRFLELRPQPRPEPGPGEVLLRVRAAAVGWVDLIMMSGQYQHMARPPYTPGLEYVGEVAAVGSGVTKVRAGDRVLADGFETGPRSGGAHQSYGGFATWALLPERAALPLPDALSWEQGTSLLGNFETAYHVLVHRARLLAGETVLILGASGSTGLAAVQLAKSLGATVVAAGRSADKLAEVAQHGADHVVITGTADGSIPRFRDEVRDKTGGVDVLWDGVGGPVSLEALRCLRFGGRFCLVGWAATPNVSRGKGRRGAPNANQLPTNLIQMKGLDVLGCPAIISTKHDPDLRPTRLAWLLQEVEAGRIVPHAGPVYPLSELHDALRAKWQSRFVGGCIVSPRA